MKNNRFLNGLTIAIFTVASSVLFTASVVVAQQSTDETIEIQAGDVFELLAYHPDPQASFAWVLMQDGNFLQAARSPFIQIRLTQPGVYVVLGEQTGGQGDPVRRLFSLIVHPVDSTQQEDQSSLPDSGLRISPVSDADGRVVLQPHQQIIAFHPIRDDLSSVHIDLDTGIDRNGDGDPTNDDDTAGTAFSRGTNALHIWQVFPQSVQQLRIASRTVDGEILSRAIAVLSADAAESDFSSSQPDLIEEPEIPEDTGDGEIRAQVLANGAVNFAAVISSVSPETPLLYQWDFGDSQQSLLQHPVHRFTGEGPYTIRLTVRDLETGEVVESLETEILLAGNVQPPESSSSAMSEASSEDSGGEPSSSNGSLLGKITKMFLVFIAAGLVGGLIAFLFSKLRRGKTLQERFAEAEKNLVGKAPAAEVVDIAPMALAPQTEQEEEPTPQPKHDAMVPNVEKLQTDTKAAPSWLQQGIQKAAEENQTITAPPPVELAQEPVATAPVAAPTPPVTTPEPEPAPMPALEVQPVSQPAPTTEEAPMPDWLKAAQSTPPAPPVAEPPPVVPAPAVTEPPPAAPIPKPESPESSVSAPALQAEPASVPSPEPVQVPTPEITAPPAAEVAPAMTPVSASEKSAEQLAREERQREKRREKRKRYRQNVKAREQSNAHGPAEHVVPSESVEQDIPEVKKQTGIQQSGEISEDEPVAFIRADSIEEQQENKEEPPAKENTAA